MERVSTVIPSLVKDGVFGDVQFKELKPEDDNNVGAQFASTLALVKLIVNSDTGERMIPLVIKSTMPERPEDGRVQFMMESLMYKEVLPALGFPQAFYPRLYYSNVSLENTAGNVLIFENIKYKNYKNSVSRTFLDFEHISLALKTIAKFHSLSFVLKHENKNKFLELIEKMKDFSFDSELASVYDLPAFAAIERGIRGFERTHGSDEILDDLLRVLKKPALLRDQLAYPEEPFDVICHGDFCNNNVMYKYGEKGKPIDCMFYDFQLSAYCNVAIELAFFLYMHTNSDTREKYWDTFLKIYYQTLRESVPKHIEIATYEEFLEYFETRAVNGYMICSFFLPQLMETKPKFWGKLPMEEQVAVVKSFGGEEGEKEIVNVLSHMYKKKYIHKFLNYIKNTTYMKML